MVPNFLGTRDQFFHNGSRGWGLEAELRWRVGVQGVRLRWASLEVWFLTCHGLVPVHMFRRLGTPWSRQWVVLERSAALGKGPRSLLIPKQISSDPHMVHCYSGAKLELCKQRHNLSFFPE